MNLRQLSYFLKIAELRSFTHAAHALYVSQPALSRQVRQLEDELGTALFVRADRGVKLTEAGELLKRRAPAILGDISQLRNELQRVYASEPNGMLTVGMGMSLRDILTVPLIAAYQARYPRVALQVREGITGTLVEDIKLGVLDCALVFEHDPQEHVAVEPFVRESLLLVGPRGAGLRLDTPLPVAQAYDRPLAVTTEDSPLRAKTQQAAQEAGVPLQVAFESNTVGILLGCVARADYFAVLPYSAIGAELADGRLCAAPIEGVALDWSFVYGRSFGLSRASAAFRDALFDAARERVDDGRWRFCSMRSGLPGGG